MLGFTLVLIIELPILFLSLEQSVDNHFVLESGISIEITDTIVSAIVFVGSPSCVYLDGLS